MEWIKRTFPPIQLNGRSLAIIFATALIYILTARLSQIFAIPPGNITPVWLPSGLMLALAFKFGARIWPGVFLGAFFGNVWAYFSTDSVTSVLFSLLSGTLNGLGDVLAIVLMANLIKDITQKPTPFTALWDFSVFIVFGGVIGALISALFGVTGLWLFGFLESDAYVYSLTNWWIGDGVGVLLLAPFLSALMAKPVYSSPNFTPILLFSTLVFSFFTAVVFDVINPVAWLVFLVILLMPLAFILMLQAGQRAVFTVQVFVASVAVVATNQQLGPFSNYQVISPLVSLQLFVAMMSCIIFSIALLVNQRNRLSLELKEKTAKLEQLYRHDPLTGLWNRYRIEEFLDNELNRFERSQATFALYLIDIDDFKEINDSRGHLEGDRILVELSEVFQSQIRAVDLLGRWGGEEFIIVAAEADSNGAAAFASKLVEIVEQHDFGLATPLTISIGFTVCKKHDSQKSIVKRADDALYKAKAKGKNQFCVEF